MARSRVFIRASGIPEIVAGMAQIGVTLKSPQVVKIMQGGAEIQAAAVRRLAPTGKTHNLQRGVYTTSQVKNNYMALTRRNGRRVNAPLRYPARKGQVLVVSSTYYGLFVERGRSPREADPTRAKPHERRAVGPQFSSRKRGKPFFRPGIRQGTPAAERYILTEMTHLIRINRVVE